MVTSTQSKGLSLIELLIGLVIVVILMTISIPSITDMIERHRAITAADELYSSLQFARSEAIKQNTTVFVSFSSGDSWCYGINTGSACSCSTPSGCNLGTKTATSPEQLSLSSNGLIGNAISFESTRGGANNSATITYTIYGESDFLRVNISRLGNISLCSNSISGYQSC